MRHLHVAVAQINSQASRPQKNLEKMLAQIKSAAVVGVEAILFAEMAVFGYDFSAETHKLAQPVDGPIAKKIAGWAQKYGMTIMTGFLENDGDKKYVSHLVAIPGKKPFAQRKCYNVGDEVTTGITSGSRNRTVFELNGVRCAVLICADTGLKGIHKELYDQKIEYLFIPTGGGGTLDQMIHEADLVKPAVQKRYSEGRKGVFKIDAILPKEKNSIRGWASANALGFDGKDRCHQGHCMIVDSNGIMRAQIPGTIVLEHQQDMMVHAVLSFR